MTRGRATWLDASIGKGNAANESQLMRQHLARQFVAGELLSDLHTKSQELFKLGGLQKLPINHGFGTWQWHLRPAGNRELPTSRCLQPDGVGVAANSPAGGVTQPKSKPVPRATFMAAIVLASAPSPP